MKEPSEYESEGSSVTVRRRRRLPGDGDWSASTCGRWLPVAQCPPVRSPERRVPVSTSSNVVRRVAPTEQTSRSPSGPPHLYAVSESPRFRFGP